MSMLNTVFNKIARPNTKQLVVAGVFSLALAGITALGFQLRGTSHALTTVRSCEHNSIDSAEFPGKGDCGAYTPDEFIKDMRNNKPNDLQVLAQNFQSDLNLSPSQYDDFAAHAVDGIAFKNGDIKTMDGTLIMKDAWSIGRDAFSYSKPFTVPHDTITYHKSTSQDVFLINEIPVIIYFDNNGNAQFIVMKPCGNFMGGTKIVSSATCDNLKATPDTKNPNLYSFTTSATLKGNAKLQKVVYHFGDGTTDTETSFKAVTHTFSGDASVTVDVFATAPGGKIIVTHCKTDIKFVPPIALCTALVPTVLDTQNQKFRFTVKTMTKLASLKNVDFSEAVQGGTTVTVTGVTTTDASGNVIKDYTFTDGKTHKVVALAHFTTISGAQKTSTCEASVTSKKPPVCTVPGHEGQPVDSKCKPNPPVTPPKPPTPPTPPVTPPTPPTPPTPTPTPTPTPPATPTALVNTGPGDTVGLVIGVTVAGYAAHRFFLSRRATRRTTTIA